MKGGRKDCFSQHRLSGIMAVIVIYIDHDIF